MAEGKHFAKPPVEEETKKIKLPKAPKERKPDLTEEELQKRNKTILIVLGSVIGAILLVYLGGALFFSRFFFPNTTINGREMSLASCWSLNDEISEQVSGYHLVVAGDGLNLDIVGSEVGVTADVDRVVEELMGAQNPWTWPAELFGTHELTYDPKATYDPNLLASVVTPAVEAVNAVVTPSQNAFVGYNDQTKRFEIVKEVYGSAVNLDQVVQACGNSIVALQPELTLDEQYQQPPAVLSSDQRLTQQLNEANRILGASIDITVGGVVVTTVKGENMAQWVHPNPETFSVDFDEDALRAWGNEEFATKYDTADTDRTYTRPDGKVVTVSGGTYGWVLDSSELVDLIIGAVKVGSTEPIAAPTKQEGEFYAGPGQKDWGNSWVDVDISEQHARYYDDAGNLVWETDVVTGDSVLAHDTPQGVYFIHDMVRDTVLVGLIDPKTGEPEYRSPVSYWMPFKSGNWGLHDAPWRYSFGGTIYQGNGSHGCVNLPVDAAAELYGLVHVGTVVITHY